MEESAEWTLEQDPERQTFQPRPFEVKMLREGEDEKGDRIPWMPIEFGQYRPVGAAQQSPSQLEGMLLEAGVEVTATDNDCEQPATSSRAK